MAKDCQLAPSARIWHNCHVLADPVRNKPQSTKYLPAPPPPPATDEAGDGTLLQKESRNPGKSLATVRTETCPALSLPSWTAICTHSVDTSVVVAVSRFPFAWIGPALDPLNVAWN